MAYSPYPLLIATSNLLHRCHHGVSVPQAMRRRSERGRGVVVASWAGDSTSPAGDIIRQQVAGNVHMYRAVKRAAGGEGEPVSFADMLGLLGREGPQGEEAREALLQALGSSPFDAYFFECVPLPPPSVRAMQSVGFEFVLADAPPLQAITHRYPPFHHGMYQSPVGHVLMQMLFCARDVFVSDPPSWCASRSLCACVVSPDPRPFAQHFQNDTTTPIKVHTNTLRTHIHICI